VFEPKYDAIPFGTWRWGISGLDLTGESAGLGELIMDCCNKKVI
jgi:hypothetical protein